MRDLAFAIEDMQSIAGKLQSDEALSAGEKLELSRLLDTIVEAHTEGRTDLVLKWGGSAGYVPMMLMFPPNWRDIEIAMVNDVAKRFAGWMHRISVSDPHYRMTGEGVDVHVKTDTLQASYDGHEISGLFWQLSMKFKNYK